MHVKLRMVLSSVGYILSHLLRF